MNNANLWERIFSHKEWGKYPSENLIRFIARNFYNVRDRNAIKILELGFGTGANLWFCAREGFRVSGIEWSKIGVQRFTKRMQEEGLHSQIDSIIIGDYEEKLDAIQKQSFDCIIDNCSLCCNDFHKARRILLKAIEKLKSGASFYSSTLAKGIVGYDANEDDFQVPSAGIYTQVGKLRFSNQRDIKRLYRGENFKLLSLKIHSVYEKNALIDKLFIIEAKKIDGGGGLKKTPIGSGR